MKLKVGDVVYFVEEVNHSTDEVTEDIIIDIDEANGGYDCNNHWFTDDDIGVRVFLTYREAYDKYCRCMTNIIGKWIIGMRNKQ